MDAMEMQDSGDQYVLKFENIRYFVKVKHGEAKGQTKQILHGVSGVCHSGRLMALMGPSGAGKTSLLDILANVKLTGTSSGKIFINGTPRRSSAFRQISAYVQQKDVLVPSATVREALTTSALLKLPYSWTKQQKQQRVEELLTNLELARVANTLIGEETFGIKGISGGEKRRVSVGIELVKDPTILFLDEPTTGLDSEMALGVMTVLKQLALSGKMVVCTIHQPNSDITDQFHDWMLLARGHLLYGGPWSGAVSYFEGLGYPCPMYKNPTDVFINLASDLETVMSLTKAFHKDKDASYGDLTDLDKGGLIGPGTSSSPPVLGSLGSAMEHKGLQGAMRKLTLAWAKGTEAQTEAAPPAGSGRGPNAGAVTLTPLVKQGKKEEALESVFEDDWKEHLSAGSSKDQGLQRLDVVATTGAVKAAGDHADLQRSSAGSDGSRGVILQHKGPRSAPSPSAKSSLTRAPSGMVRSASTGSFLQSGAGSTEHSATPIWYQVYILMVRFFKSWMRTPIMILAEAAQYIILGIFTGLLYLQSPNVLPDGPFDKMSSVFLTLCLLAFTPSYTALIVWDYERQLLRRESATGTYRRGSFFIAKSLTTAPIEIVQVTIYAIILYFMVGYQQTLQKFLVYWFTLVLFALCSETIGYLCAIVTPDSKMGVAVLTVLMVIILSFSGYLVRRVPVYFAWIGKTSYFSFATDILVTNEFEGLKFTMGANPRLKVDAMTLIPAAMKTGLGLYGNLGVLAGLTLACRALSWVLLEMAAAFKFL